MNDETKLKDELKTALKSLRMSDSRFKNQTYESVIEDKVLSRDLFRHYSYMMKGSNF